MRYVVASTADFSSRRWETVPQMKSPAGDAERGFCPFFCELRGDGILFRYRFRPLLEFDVISSPNFLP
jgi:hypothetical protein